MATRFTTICVDAADPHRLADFWSRAIGWESRPDLLETDRAAALAPPDEQPGGLFFIAFLPVADPESGAHRVHLDLATGSMDEHDALVARSLAAGGRHLDIGQGDDVPWTVLADPEGNPFCVMHPRQRYEGSGAIGAIPMDAGDPHVLAAFWVAASGWEVAGRSDDTVTLRSPDGRGPLLELCRWDTAKTVKNRIHLDVSPFPDDDQGEEVERLIALGARRLDIGQVDVSWTVLADPDGNELCVLTPR